ncbi:insulinase family protein [Amycolatopsis rhizosphaerae]|uniref:Insulinase family protein n=1 Tax=Amycolatopsis rhizosphaerae TaxID=2053003 RepID=A0A558CYS0_9PSEU|nr:insulinase family protein [Amycolatopsis rhizosphaerae]TVT53915.1 insulinase family protein [Amycolatopsis rhizosphaerae]
MIEQIEIDGVQAVFVKRSGPTRAGLQFRVGRADERLSTSGITHMVEHLALHRFGLTEYHSNGLTSAVATQFFATGSDSEISTFLHGVCTGLADLPLDRLETERAILRTEGAARASGALDRLARIRYGAQGYGLTGYPEYGVGRISAEDVRSWAESWFTRQNAVLWIAGERVPAELDLPLPEGARRPAPEPRPVVASAGYIESGTGRVFVESVIRRGMAGRLLALLLERELFRSLRQEGGYSYTATASYSVWGRDSATLTALADALPEQQDAVLARPGARSHSAAPRRGRAGDGEHRDRTRQGQADAVRHTGRRAGPPRTPVHHRHGAGSEFGRGRRLARHRHPLVPRPGRHARLRARTPAPTKAVRGSLTAPHDTAFG